MNAREKKLMLTIVVLTLTGTSAYWGLQRPRQEPPASPTPPDIDQRQAARISKLTDVDGDGYEGRGIFQYAPPRLTPQPLPNDTFTADPPFPPGPEPPPRPEPPRPGPLAVPVADNLVDVPLVYNGFARDDSGTMTAFFETNGQGGVTSGHFNLKEGDYLVGRVRVTRITPDAVEVEDMDRAESATKRKQLFNIKK
jgi:hypothetical protein